MDEASTSGASDLWTALGNPRYVLAPMVDQSELAWRMLARRRGVHLCYTPMYHASVFARDATYRNAAMQSCTHDRPLVVQFCANEADTLVRCADLVTGQCDAVDLNLGCPQSIARRGHYGAFLQDEWHLIYDMVSAVSSRCSVPVTCKIRVFADAGRTVRYAQMLQRAGATAIAVHGRTREQKGDNTALADWNIIRMVKQAVTIPVIANGNIQTFQDVAQCFKQTGCDAAMSAEGHLHNPSIFDESKAAAAECHYDVALEYIDLVRQYPADMAVVRAHLFKLFHHTLLLDNDMRVRLGRASDLSQVVQVVHEIRAKCQAGELVQPPKLATPHHLCQPYYRTSHVAKGAGIGAVCAGGTAAGSSGAAAAEKAAAFRLQVHSDRNALHQQTGASKRLIRKLEKRVADPRVLAERALQLLHKAKVAKRAYDTCACGNAMGAKCEHGLCKTCCRRRAVHCDGHRFRHRAQKEAACDHN